MGVIMRTNLMYEFDAQTNKQTSVDVIDWLLCMLALLIYFSLSLSPTLQSQYAIPSNKKISIHPSIHPSVNSSASSFFQLYSPIRKKKRH